MSDQEPTFDLGRILESKRIQRLTFAALPIAEKLRMLDMLRERQVAIRGGSFPRRSMPANGEESHPAPSKE